MLILWQEVKENYRKIYTLKGYILNLLLE